MIVLRRVVGDSMTPVLRPDQLIIAWRTRRVRPGDVVIALHDGKEKVKRLHSVSDGQVFLLGDNPNASTDSRHFGWLPQRAVFAKVLWPKTRARA
ncbi:MAG TPA: nickel-type superoxide dismutase maturation protease [Candidatus Saccharimonadales bacterium]